MPLNTPEKIAATYLRLNGFFLMQHFTVFSEDRASRQSDLLAVRPPNSQEKIGGVELRTDARFLKMLGGPKVPICVATEVKGDEACLEAEKQLEKSLPYDVRIFGTLTPVRKLVFCNQDTCMRRGEVVRVSIEHSLGWIFDRLEDTEKLTKEKRTVSKQGSWVWSEEFLSDLIYLWSLGLGLEHTCTLK